MKVIIFIVLVFYVGGSLQKPLADRDHSPKEMYETRAVERAEQIPGVVSNEERKEERVDTVSPIPVVRRKRYASAELGVKNQYQSQQRKRRSYNGYSGQPVEIYAFLSPLVPEQNVFLAQLLPVSGRLDEPSENDLSPSIALIR